MNLIASEWIKTRSVRGAWGRAAATVVVTVAVSLLGISGLLADGGSPSQCGWLKDRFGLSWQIVPRALEELLQDRDSARAARAMQAMLTMQKLDVAALRAAADG